MTGCLNVSSYNLPYTRKRLLCKYTYLKKQYNNDYSVCDSRLRRAPNFDIKAIKNTITLKKCDCIDSRVRVIIILSFFFLYRCYMYIGCMKKLISQFAMIHCKRARIYTEKLDTREKEVVVCMYVITLLIRFASAIYFVRKNYCQTCAPYIFTREQYLYHLLYFCSNRVTVVTSA